MNVLVSGSRGLIGSALVDRLRREGHTVTRLARPGRDRAPVAGGSNASTVATPDHAVDYHDKSSPDRPNAGAPGGGASGLGASGLGSSGPASSGPASSGRGASHTVAWDPSAGRLDRQALDRSGPIDAVVNLAGAGIGDRRWSESRRRLIDSSRRLSTRLLAETAAALDPAPSVLVSASAVGIYGDRGDEILTEASAPGTGFLADVCRAWEAAAGPAADAGIRVVCLRSGVVLSPEGGFLPRILPLFRIGLGGRLGSGRQFVSWITLADEVDVILRAIADEHLAGPLNATAPRPVTNRELTRAIGRALRRPTPFAVPRAGLGLVMGRDLAGELLLASQRAVPAQLQTHGHRFGTTDLDDALASMVGGRPTARG